MILITAGNRPLRGESLSPTSTFCGLLDHSSLLATPGLVCSANKFHVGVFYVLRSRLSLPPVVIFPSLFAPTELAFPFPVSLSLT